MSKKDDWQVPEVDAEGVDLDVEFDDLEEGGENKTSEKKEDVKQAPAGISAIDLERMVASQGQTFAENYLLRRAAEDPEFAEYLKKGAQQQKTPEKKEDVKPPEKKKTSDLTEEKISQLEKRLLEFEYREKQKSEESEWSEAYQSAQRLVGDDPVFGELSPDSREELVTTFVMAYKSNSENKNFGVKKAYEVWRKTPLKLRNDFVKGFIQKKKAVKSIPVTPDEAYSAVMKDQKDLKIDAKALESGKLGELARAFLQKVRRS